MKDKNGVYYYPFPQNPRVRMYVKQGKDDILFRLWNEDDPELWKEHGWRSYDDIQAAIRMYKGGPFDPRRAYDIVIAKEVLKEEQNKK